ncbi:CRISPR-associated protein Cas4 [Thermogladius sp. 4427co]|uniref:CRISPR-associated protein Cas4 n=1 Tax=Thermogladius sp. 4427co TaxID=3450718 RepID=UPI003F7A0D08
MEERHVFQVFVPREGKISPLLYRYFMEEQLSRINELSSPSIVYVTDLVSCHHKFHMRKQYPELTISFEPSAIMGNLIHLGLESIVRNHGFIPEYQVEKHIEIGGAIYILKGRVDAYNPDTREVLEIKSVKTFQGEPYRHHLDQLNIYLNMLNASRGILLYISHDRIVEFEVKSVHVDLEEELKKLVYDETHPKYTWECRYCPFRKLCPYRREEAEGEG